MKVRPRFFRSPHRLAAIDTEISLREHGVIALYYRGSVFLHGYSKKRLPTALMVRACELSHEIAALIDERS